MHRLSTDDKQTQLMLAAIFQASFDARNLHNDTVLQSFAESENTGDCRVDIEVMISSHIESDTQSGGFTSMGRGARSGETCD